VGCNFYLIDSEKHIGKRSAAGWYCWDCGQTLCVQGENGIHESKSNWDDECFSCGKTIPEESVENSSAGRELGFNKSKPRPKKGVASCSSFTWTINPTAVLLRYLFRLDDVVIRDEYNHEYTFKVLLLI